MPLPTARVPRTIAALLLASAALAGCSGQPRDLEPPPYPAALEQSRTLDVQVFRRGTKLIATNTSATAFGPSRVWVNQEFSLPINGFGVGETLELELKRFKNTLGSEFRAGGFFASLSPKAVVLVQIEPEGADALIGFVVVEDEPR